jgi:hypothetical protein
MKARTWLEGAGAGLLLTLRYTWLHLSPLHSDLYHRLLPLNSIFWGVAIDLVFVSLLASFILGLLDRYDPSRKSLWWALLAGFLASRVYVFLVWLGIVSASLIKPQLLLILCLVAAIAFWFLARRFYPQAVEIFRLGLALVGLSIFWALPQLVYMAMRPEPHEQPTFVRPVTQAALPQRRIIWLLFDELSQDQVIDHRQPGIQLPELDSFRSQSVMFSDVQPAGYYTELVLPSLILGKRITGERSDLQGQLSVKTTDMGWHKFPVDESIFAAAQRSGWPSGVAGWYNPYCRTYASVLNWCAWTLTTPLPGEYSPDQSVLLNAFAPIRRSTLRLIGQKQHVPSSAQNMASDDSEIMQWSHELIDDENIRFLLIHLPVPHPGGYYNRHTGELGVAGSYLDNLVLADKTLGQLTQWINATHSAPQTTIILCSDHSWRVPMWRKSPQWTSEDERVSGNRFDPRPVLMVRFPDETTPRTIAQPFPALKEHNLIDALMHNAMSPSDLEAWAAQQH